MLFAAASLVASSGVLAAPAAARPVSPQPPKPAYASVRVGGGAFGRAIPPSFLGLAMEYRGVVAYAGPDSAAINPVLVQMIRNLAPGQSPLIRIGGDSTDWTWWPQPGLRKPAGVSYALTPGWLATVRALLQATNARGILGVNLEANRPLVAGAEARALIRGLGQQRVRALEIGNEPELYAVLPWSRTLAGKPIIGRPPGYSLVSWDSDFARARAAIPSYPLAAPATGNLDWLANLGAFLSVEPAVQIVTFHRYPLNRCRHTMRGTARYPTVPNLLALGASRALMQGTASAIAAAHRRGIPIRVGEMGPVTCGGTWGVSNSFASALWVLDALFAIATTGADGVNIQTAPWPGTSNEIFYFHQRGGRWQGWPRPEYYGLLMFAQAAPPGSRLLDLGYAGGTQIRIWATRTPTDQIHLVAINTSLSRPASIRVRLPSASAPATVERLLAPSAYATGGVTLAGQSFAGTTTGLPVGSRVTWAVRSSAGSYTLTLPASSAAMLTVAAAHNMVDSKAAWGPGDWTYISRVHLERGVIQSIR